MSVVPAPTIVTVLPTTVATRGLLLVNVTGCADAPPVAVKAKSASPKVLVARAAKVMI